MRGENPLSYSPHSRLTPLTSYHRHSMPHRVRVFWVRPQFQRYIEEKVVQLSHPSYSLIRLCDLFLFHFFLFFFIFFFFFVVVINPEVHLIVQFANLLGIPKKAYFSAFTEWIVRLENCVFVKRVYFGGLK